MIALQEKVAAFDAVTFKSVFCITSCYPASAPNLNPMTLGTRWLAYADRKVHTYLITKLYQLILTSFKISAKHCQFLSDEQYGIMQRIQ